MMNRSVEADSGTMPPQALDAERATLGSMCCSVEALDPVAGMLTDADFYCDANAIIFRALDSRRGEFSA
jgi:replicative DNA helicase